jgi:hypothetical protein
VGEGIRRSQDLDQWASFHDSFVALEGLIHRVGAGEKSTPPASITLLSVGVHHGYLAEAAFPDGDGFEESRIYQAVCSPLRNALLRQEVPPAGRRLDKASYFRRTPPLSRLARIEKGEMSWHLTHDRPWFENHVATLELEGRQANITFEEAFTDAAGEPGLRRIFTRRLA